MLSCSNTGANSDSINSDFHPPAWIQGNWIQAASGTSGTMFSFTANDFCVTNMGVARQCQQEYVNQIRQPGISVTVSETITATTYIAEIKYYAGQTVIYSFKKLSNTSIQWTAVTGSVFIKQ